MSRYDKKILKSQEWRVIRMQALHRDDWKCRECGSRHNLEVDHIKPVQKFPDLVFEIGNLQTLCKSCHSTKTNLELGRKPNPRRRAWQIHMAKERHEINRANRRKNHA